MFNETLFAEFGVPFFATLLGLSEDDVKEKAVTPEGQADLRKLYGEKRKEVKTEGYKEAQGKTQKQLNKAIKDVFGVEIGGDVNDVTAAVQAIKDGYKPEETPEDNPQQLTEKAVKQHPLFIQTEKEKNEALTKLKAKEDEFTTTLETTLNKRVATLTLQQQAENALTELKAKLPTHKGQRDLAVEAYRKAFENIEARKIGDQTIYYDQDGNRLEDEMGNPMNWDQLKHAKASQFFELEGPERESPGAKPPGGQPAGGGNGGVNLSPKTMDELNKVLENQNVKAEDKTKAKDYYKANGTDLG